MNLAFSLLKKLPPEASHNIAKWFMRGCVMSPGLYVEPIRIMNNNRHFTVSNKPVILFNQEINNRLGMAAGFDKNGELIDIITQYGFGFIEIGSVTYHGGPGNPKPRLFRIEDDHLLNRMGLNGHPAITVVERLKTARSKAFAVNVAKTHSPDILGDKAIRDVVNCYDLIKHYGIYTALNVSCPNTKEGKTFEEPESLKELLLAIDECKRIKPLLIKISPILINNPSKFMSVIDVCENAGIDGYIACNTIPHEHPKFGRGGMSGHLVKSSSVQTVRLLRDFVGTKPIIGVGGIYNGDDMFDYLNAGATVCEAYCGFVRGPNAGPRFAHDALEKCNIREWHHDLVRSSS